MCGKIDEYLALPLMRTIKGKNFPRVKKNLNLVNSIPLCYYRSMRWSSQKIFLLLYVFLSVSVPLFSQLGNSPKARVKWIFDGNALVFTNREGVRLIGVYTLDVHESPRL